MVCVYSSKKRAGRRLALTAEGDVAAPSSVGAVTSEGFGGGGGGGLAGGVVAGGVTVGGEVNPAPVSPANRTVPPGWRGPVTLTGYGGGGGAVGGFFRQPYCGGPGYGNGWAVAGNPAAVMMDPSGGSGSSGGCGPGAFSGPGPAYGGSGLAGGGAGMVVGSSAFSGVAGAGAAKMLHRGIAAAFRAVRLCICSLSGCVVALCLGYDNSPSVRSPAVSLSLTFPSSRGTLGSKCGLLSNPHHFQMVSVVLYRTASAVPRKCFARRHASRL